MKEKIALKFILLLISSKFGVHEIERSWADILECDLHDVFFNVNNFLHNNFHHTSFDTVERTLADFATLLKTIFEEDDDPKGISSDNESNLDS